MKYKACVIGTSAGGIEALKEILGNIKPPLRVPLIIVQHLSPRYESYLPSIIEHIIGIPTKEVDEKELIKVNRIYIAPPNYHILIEKDFSFSLTTEARVSYARPSIDILFETAADAYKDTLIGVLLTGANHDGAMGLDMIHKTGGYTIVQQPSSAYAKEMPEAAIKMFHPDEVLDLKAIGIRLNQLIGLGVS